MSSTRSSGPRSAGCSSTPSSSAPRSTAASPRLRTEHPAARRRETLERDLARADDAIARLIEAYQEQLISLDELRARMPALRKRQSTLRAQLDSLDAELHDAETYLQLADTLEGFLDRLTDGLDQLDTAGQQRILRLVVREVLIGGDDDTITIRHSIPTPTEAPMTQVTFCVGAVVSPVLLNIALDGMEQAAGVRYQSKGSIRVDSPAVIRYADDFIVHCHTRQDALEIKAELAAVVGVQGSSVQRGQDARRHPRGRVGSSRGAVPALPPVRFPDPPAEPDVPIPEHPALHRTRDG